MRARTYLCTTVFLAAPFALAFAQRGRQGTAPAVAETTIIQAVGLAAIIVFVFSVWASGFTAKRINNISGATYTKAFLATLLKGLLSLAGIFVFGLFLRADPIVALVIAYSIIPIAVYRIVFASMWREAALVWFVALIVEGVVGYALFWIGVLSLAPFMSGS